MNDASLADVITEIRQLWPECRMVRGSPRHSESNGGVERVNRTVQAKLGTWMQDTGSRRWTIGCKIVMWRYNTQQHRTVGNIPYRLLFGQVPRVGISSLHLDTALLDTLATEAELNRVAEYEGMVREGDVDGRVDDAVEQAEEEVQVPMPNEDAEEVDVQPVNAEDAEDAEDVVEAEIVEETSSSSDEDESLTLTQLGERAQTQQASELKTSGDVDFTVWQVLASEMSDSVTVDSDYLQQIKLREKVPIAYCLNIKNIASLDSFIPAIWCVSGKHCGR